MDFQALFQHLQIAWLCRLFELRWFSKKRLLISVFQCSAAKNGFLLIENLVPVNEFGKTHFIPATTIRTILIFLEKLKTSRSDVSEVLTMWSDGFTVVNWNSFWKVYTVSYSVLIGTSLRCTHTICAYTLCLDGNPWNIEVPNVIKQLWTSAIMIGIEQARISNFWFYSREEQWLFTNFTKLVN